MFYLIYLKNSTTLYKRTLIKYLIYDFIINICIIGYMIYFYNKNKVLYEDFTILLSKTFKVWIVKLSLLLYYFMYIPKHHIMRLSEYQYHM